MGSLARIIVPDAEYAPDESFSGKGEIEFEDSCGCFSEWTQEPCSLTINLRGTLELDGSKQRQEIEKALDKWAQSNLTWSGCDCCGNSLIVWVRLYAKGSQ